MEFCDFCNVFLFHLWCLSSFSSSSKSWLVLCHSRFLVSMFGQWIGLTIVILVPRISVPYHRTVLRLCWKILILMLTDSCSEFQKSFSCGNNTLTIISLCLHIWIRSPLFTNYIVRIYKSLRVFQNIVIKWDFVDTHSIVFRDLAFSFLNVWAYCFRSWCNTGYLHLQFSLFMRRS